MCVAIYGGDDGREEDIEEIRKERPDRIYPSRYHLRRKPVDMADGGIGFKPKWRWIIVGFHDLDILYLDGVSPTASSASTNILPTVLAGLPGPVRRKDIKCATERYAMQPHAGVPGLGPRQNMRLEKEVCGTVMGMALSRWIILEDLAKMGYFSACRFLLKGATSRLAPQERHRLQDEWLLSYTMVEQASKYHRRNIPFEKTEGRLTLQVDGLLESGGATRREKMDKLSKNDELGQDDDWHLLGGD